MESLIQQLKGSRYAGSNRYLTELDFGMMLILAGAFHLAGIVAYHLMPEAKPEEIPVKVLNVRLGVDTGTMFDPYGFGDGMAPGDAEQNAGLNLPGVQDSQPAAPSKPLGAGDEAALAHPASHLDMMLSQLELEEEKKNKAKGKKSKAAPAKAVDEGPRTAVNRNPHGVRYVRPSGQWGAGNPAETGIAGEGGTGAATYGSPLGNSTDADAELLRRYEQVISLWIKRYVFYPEEARAQNRPQGEAKVLIRVNNEGRILGYRINETSGNLILDRAIPTILDRANPLPKNPDYDTKKEYESYVVSIVFERID